MARLLFGGEPFEIYLHDDEDGDLHAYGPLVAKFYDAFDDSASPVVDLLGLDEEGLDEVAVVGVEDEFGLRGQLPAFYGPDEVYELWVSVNGSPRQLLRPVNLGSDLAPTKQAVDLLFNSGDPNPFDTALIDLLDVDREVVEEAPEGSTLIKTSSGLYTSGSSPIPLSDILWVAASDAPANFQGAPYVCDGVADEEEINAALSNPLGLKVGLSPGNFALADVVRMHFSSNPAAAAAVPRTQYLIGSGQSVTKLNVAVGVLAGIYFYDNVSPHVWDMTINVNEQRAIWAWKTGGAQLDYRSAFNGSIRRVTVNGPSNGSNGNWAMSLKSIDNFLIEDVSTTNTRYGLEVVAESAEQKPTKIVFRNCRVIIIGDGGQCFRAGIDAGENRQIHFDTCYAGVASPTQTTTEGFRISSIGGQTYGVTLTNCTASNVLYAIHTWPNVTDVDADFALIEPRQGGYGVWAEGGSSRFRISEFRVPSTVTTATLMSDNYTGTMVNQYWHHIYTQSASTAVGGYNPTGIVRRGIAEGLGTVASNVLRNPGQLVDRTNIDPVQVTTTATVGTVNTGFTALDTKIRHTPDGKVIYGWFRIRSTNLITPTSNNMPDTDCFTLNAAYRPTDQFVALWSTGTATGGLIIYPTGIIRIATGNQPIAANAVLTFSFVFIKD
jgi:hypothetical protein